MRKNTISDFEEFIIPITESGCFIFNGTILSTGYGVFWFKNKPFSAHRFSWIINYGDIPEKMCVCHKCDIPSCVNPHHLFLGTHAENAADRDKKGRGNYSRGEKKKNSKLTEEDVKKIRLDNSPHRKIAIDYGVARSVISRVKNRSRWGHVK